jgi:acetyl-CoA C-acetyltransferase
MGGLGGAFADASAAELGGTAIAAAMNASGITAAEVDELIMGCVLSAGQGQAPARQAGFHGGLGQNVPASTVNKMCGSGMRAVMIAHDQLALGDARVMVAGGMESMTNAPYLLHRMRRGTRLSHDAVIDHMFLDGLENAYEKGRLMGTFAEHCAVKYQFTRAEQDAYALSSLERARNAADTGIFSREIAEHITGRPGKQTRVIRDEQLDTARAEKIPHLKPAFSKDGTVTAANASSISDGAAALVLMRESEAKARGAKVRARILGHASHAHMPSQFATAPIPAIRKLIDRCGLKQSDVELWEINEAFAVVPMAAMAELGGRIYRPS